MKLLMKKVLTVVLSVMMLVVFMPTSAFAAGGNGGENGQNDQNEETTTPPTTEKTLTSNDNGTYKLSLSVTGKSSTETESSKADVIIIFDKSYSMTYDKNGNRTSRKDLQRLTLAQQATNNLIHELLSQNADDENVQVGLVSFGTSASADMQLTANEDKLKNKVNGYTISGTPYTNWEAALQEAKKLQTRSDAKKYVIFVSDGNPSTCSADGGRFIREGNPDCYNHAQDDAKALVDAGYEFFGVGVFGNINMMQSIVKDAGAPEKNYYSASDSEELMEAFKSIINEITKNFGYKEVAINDGLTKMTTVMGEVSDFEYKISGGSYGEGQTWEDAPKAVYDGNSKKVTWNLGEMLLEDGVKYTVSFTVWPSQEAYDLVADLNNEKVKYEDLTSEQKSQIVKTDNGYGLKTNTNASVDYTQVETKTTKKKPEGYEEGKPAADGFTYTYDSDTGIYTGTKETGGNGPIKNPDPVPLTGTKINVNKAWVGGEGTGDIKLKLMQDGEDTGKTVTLNSDNHWTEQVYIAPGLKVNGKTLETGHDYCLEEVDTGYRYEFDSTTCHPMLIDSATEITNPDGKACVLKGTNTKRSDLNITKTVIGTTDTSKLFTFKVNVADKNSENVWFSIGNGKDVIKADNRVTGATAEMKDGAKTGYYFADSAADLTIKIKSGENIFFTNLPVGSEYSVEEINLPDGYKLQKVVDKGKEQTASKVEGEITKNNKTYTVAYTNQYVQPVEKALKVTKKVEGRNAAESFTFSMELANGSADGVVMPESKTVTTTNNIQKDNSETVTFNSIKFTKPGTYTFKVKETNQNAPAGWTYDGSEKTITVTVRDDGDKLVADVQGDNPTFTNSYSASEASITLKAKKILENLDLAENQFSFQLIDSEGKVIETKQNDADGNVTFTEISYGAEDVYDYKVKEVLPDGVTADNPKKDGITYDTSVKDIKVKVEDNSQGQLVASVIEGSQISTFTNTYNASGESTVKGLKVLQSETGKTLKGGEYTFTISAKEGTPMPEKTEVTNGPGSSSVLDFGKIEFKLKDLGIEETETDDTVKNEEADSTVEGDDNTGNTEVSEPAKTKPAEKTFTYTVKETGNMPGVNNDSDKTFRITIKDDGKGGIIATTDPAGDYAFTFNNVHTAAAVNPGVNKAFIYSTGEPAWGEYSNAEFEFTLEAITEGAPMPATTTVKATKDELDPYFGVIKFNEPGTYEYIIKEKQGNLKNVTYDTEEHKVKVVVTEAKDESLSADITYDDNKDSLTITNTVEKTSVSGEKNWEDEALQETGKYTRPESITVQLMADGTAVKGKTQTVTADNSWKYTFDNLDRYDENGDEIEYSVVETKIGGKDVSESGFEVKYSGYNITNTPKDAEKLIPVALSIIKTDANTGQGLAGAVFKITKNGETAEKVTEKTDSDGKTTFTFEEEGTYVVAEKTAPEGYDATETRWSVEVEKGEITEIKVIEGFWTKIYQLIFGNGTDSSIEGDTLTVANPPEKTKVPVEKIWNDNDNQDGVRPDSVTVNLLADGAKVEGKTLELNADNSWKGEFEDLDAYKDGKKIKYTVTEDDVAGYTLKDITGDAKEGYVITNKHTPELTSISGSKTWNDAALKETGKYTRPESITVRLLADGKAVDDQTQTVTADDNWTYEFKNLDKYKDGEKITYTVEEIKVGDESVSDAGFTATYDEAHLNITNTPTSLKVTKHLDKFGEPLKAQNTTFYVALFSDPNRTELVAGPQGLAFNGDSSTYTIFEKLKPGTYYVGETDEAGNVLGEGESQGVEVLPIDGEDYFVEIGTSSYLDYDSKVVIGEDTSKEFTNVVREVPPPGHYHQFTLKKAVTDIEGTEKEYSGDFYVGVYKDKNHTERVQGLKGADGKELVNPVKLTLNNASSASITVEVPELDKTYFLAETDADGNPVDSEFRFIHKFSGDIDENDSIIVTEDSDVNVTLTNKDRELIDIGFDLEWDDYSNRDNTRDEYKVTLYADGVKVGEEITCDKDKYIKGEGKYEWKDLPKYSETGDLIKYTVKETGVPGKYTSNTDDTKFGIEPDKDGIVHLKDVYRAFTLTKKVLDSKGKAVKYNGDFYVTLYTDAECTQKADIQNNPVKISLKNESEKTVVVEVPADDATYYLAETDARGNKVDSKFKFTPTLSKTSVEITADSNEHIDLVNKAKPGKDINTKTGDSANLMLMLMLMITSMMLGAVILLRRRQNNN